MELSTRVVSVYSATDAEAHVGAHAGDHVVAHAQDQMLGEDK